MILFRGMAGASAVGGVNFDWLLAHGFRHVGLLLTLRYQRFTHE